MKTFKGYLTEFVIQSTSDYVFDTHTDNSSSLKIPISGPMFKRIWPDTIRSTVFHVLGAEDIYDLKKLEGKKKSISAFFSMMSRNMETGIAAGGGVVAELEADVLISAKDDIMSMVDKTGRRWVEMSWFVNAQSYGTGPKFGKVEKELNTLIANLVVKHLPKDVTQGEHEYELWSDMKRHLHGDGKKLRLVIKDYFDGVEKVIKKNKEVLGNIFYGYARSKRMTDNAWDEQIVNNIKVKTVHVIKPHPTKDVWGEDEIKQHITDVHNWPIKAWDASIELEIYTRAVVAKEKGK